jgi:hypothetical protein
MGGVDDVDLHEQADRGENAALDDLPTDFVNA